jgi:hypothetical protein
MSPALSEGLERKSSKWADEGTRAHEVAEEILATRGIGSGPKTPTDHNPEMVKWVAPYVDYVEALAKKSNYYAVEKRISLAPLWEREGRVAPEALFGTSDFIALLDKILHIVDLKYGAGVAVDVQGPQLPYYALGAFLSLPDNIIPPETIRMTIVQPRAVHPDGPIRHWDIPTVDLLDWGFSTLRPTVELIAEDDRSKLSVVEGKHCRWCAAATATCPIKHKTKTAQARKDFSALE